MDRLKWNSRKVLFGLLLIAVGVCMELFAPKGFTETMAMFLAAIGASYFAGNVADKVAQTKADAKASQDAPPKDVATRGQIQAVAEQLGNVTTALGQAIEGQAQSTNEMRQALSAVIEGNGAVLKQVQYIIAKAGWK